MDINMRLLDPQTDYERVAEIINFYEPEPVTVERLQEWDAHDFEGQINRRTVAVDSDGHIVGYGAVMHTPWMKAGNFLLQALVDPAHCKQGIGTCIHTDNLDFARENEATSANTWVFEDQPQSVRFAEKHGFTVERHIFESTVDLKSYDESHFAGVIEGVEASGICLFSLADVGNTIEALQKLWDVNYRTYLDDPASSGEFPNFEEFQKVTSEAWFRPDGQLLAADGDTYIGLSAVGYFKDSNSAYNMMTGLLPAYRGRKIAQALKLLSIRAALRWGADYIRTNNDSQNAPMLAINRKLGYVAQPGGYRMVKSLGES
jgi:RimJ/RimL family protein N-acetyltransferase